MRHKNKSTRIRVVLRLIVGLTTSFFVLSLANALDAEDVKSHEGQFWIAEPVGCGDTLEDGRFELTGNLTCDDDPAIKINGPAKFNLNGYTLSGDGKNVCIQIKKAGARVWNGTVTQCGDGVVIAGTGRHRVFRMKSIDNAKTGFTVEKESNGNRIIENEAIGNLKENFLIEEESDYNRLDKNKAEDGDKGFYVRGSYNRLSKNKAERNFDDALRIRNGKYNSVTFNIFIGTESGEGVEIRSEYNTVRKNIINQNNRGIRIRVKQNAVTDNIILNNRKEGIRVESSDNVINSNIINNNGFDIDNEGIEDLSDGLKLEDGAEENTLKRNLVFNNGANGINVDSGALKNIIEHNIALGNTVDDTYYDAVDGNINCGENTWCENYFGTEHSNDCIDGQTCEVGDKNLREYDDDDDGDDD